MSKGMVKRGENYLFCPLNSNVCVGVDQCAPAVFEMEALKAQGHETDPVCPIVSIMGNMALAATAGMPDLKGKDLEDETKKETRERVLDGVSIDG